jgi:hypothetical protein
MMNKLPVCTQAIIPRNKIENYPLNFDHREGKSKAVFFSKFGYSLANSREFYEALRELACESIVVQVEERFPFGTRITTEGALRTPDSRNPKIRMGWFFDRENREKIPRLIAVIPARS